MSILARPSVATAVARTVQRLADLAAERRRGDPIAPHVRDATRS